MAKAATSIFYTAHSVRRQPEIAPPKEARPFYFAAITTLLAFAIAGALFYIGIRVKVVNLGYRINQEIQNKENLIEESKKLDLEIARLKSPTRIESEARQTLGLALPTPNQIIYIDRVAPADLSRTLALVNPGKVKPTPVTELSSEKPALAEKKVAQENASPKAAKKNPAELQQKKDIALAPPKLEKNLIQVKPEKKVAQVSPAAPTHNDKAVLEKKIDKTEKAPTLADKSKVVPHNTAVKTPTARLSDLAPIAKVASNKSSGYKAKQSVPAIMLDSMP